MNSVDKLIIWVSLKYPPIQQHNALPQFLLEITASFNGFLSIQNLTRQMTKILKRKAITLVTRSAFVPYINKCSNRQFCEWLTRFVLCMDYFGSWAVDYAPRKDPVRKQYSFASRGSQYNSRARLSQYQQYELLYNNYSFKTLYDLVRCLLIIAVGFFTYQLKFYRISCDSW